MNYIISIDQSTSATKAIVFNEEFEPVDRETIPHRQIYPRPGWVEHDPVEIYNHVLTAVKAVVRRLSITDRDRVSVSITNQRETVVVWNKSTGEPLCNAIVWQCNRSAAICRELVERGFGERIREKTGLLADPYFSAGGIKWVFDNIADARTLADEGRLCVGTIDTWLIWKLTRGRVFATDTTNASRTLLFNISTMRWDDELLDWFGVPASVLPEVKSSDSLFGASDFDGAFAAPVDIAGVIGDSHGAFVGQMCFQKGLGKATYGTGSSVMIHVGDRALPAPAGLVASVGFTACGKTHYVFEGNVHCTGGTLKWLTDRLSLISDPSQSESLAGSVDDNGGVYFVPAFAGLGAPWWNADARAVICGMTLDTGKAHVVRAALEAIAYQIKDLTDLVAGCGIELEELRIDGGPAKNRFLVQFQADMLGIRLDRMAIEESSAMGAAIMNALARNVYGTLKQIAQKRKNNYIEPQMSLAERERLYAGWLEAVRMIDRKKITT